MSFSVAASPPAVLGPAQWASLASQGGALHPWAAHAGLGKPGSSLPARVARGPSPAKAATSRSTEEPGAGCGVTEPPPQKRVEGFQVGSCTSGWSHSVVPLPSSLKGLRAHSRGRDVPSKSTGTSPNSDSEAPIPRTVGFSTNAQRRMSLDRRPASLPGAAADGQAVKAASPKPHLTEAAVVAIIPPVSPSKKEGLLHRQLTTELTPPSPIAGLPLSLGYAVTGHSRTTSEATEAVLSAWQERHAVFSSPLVVQAFRVASRAHAGQTWQDGRPFIEHAAGTAGILADLGLDETTVAAGVLHGVLDRTMMTTSSLAGLLDEQPAVAEMVQNVSRLSEVSQMHRLSASGEPALRRLRAMLLGMADVRVVIVKLAERVHGMRTVGKLDALIRTSLASEALEVFAPLANRLGVWALKAELEDLAFYTLHPQEYSALKGRVSAGASGPAITASLDRLKDALEATGMHPELSGRPKNLWGVFTKMRNKGYSTDQIYDVKAVRVIVSSKAECYEALRQVHTLWRPVDGRLKDYIRYKKKNGYQSLHTVVMGDDGVPFEVQIRTAKMHYIAEHGVAAHWRYKEESAAKGQGQPVTASVDEMGSSPDAVADQHVAWARWLITWELELQDKKCRPSGSPERDTALSSLHQEVCRFPNHSEACPFRSLQMGRPAEVPGVGPALAIYCVVVHRRHGSRSSEPLIDLKELPAGLTTSQLREGGHLGNPTLLAGKHLLVNHQEEEVQGETVLRMGDQIEIVDAPAPCEHLEPQVLDEQRRLFDSLFYRTPSAGEDMLQATAL